MKITTTLKPFQVLSETEVYDDANRLVVVNSHLLTPEGKEVDWSYIKIKDGVIVIPVDQDGNVYVKVEWRLARRGFVWEFPSGLVETIDPTTADIEATANRELQEEIGRKAKKLVHLVSYYPSNYTTGKFHIFLATGLEESNLPKDEHEYLEVKKLPFEEAYISLTQEQVPTAQTVLAFLMARERLKDIV